MDTFPKDIINLIINLSEIDSILKLRQVNSTYFSLCSIYIQSLYENYYETDGDEIWTILKIENSRITHNSLSTFNSIFPEEKKGLIDNGHHYDARISYPVLAIGRYRLVGVHVPETITYLDTLPFSDEEKKSITKLSCLYLSCSQPHPEIKELEFCFFSPLFKHLEMSLASAVYDCWGDSGTDFDLKLRGIDNMFSLFPNVEYLKLSWPRLIWADQSHERQVDFDRFNFYEQEVKDLVIGVFPSLKFLDQRKRERLKDDNFDNLDDLE